MPTNPLTGKSDFLPRSPRQHTPEHYRIYKVFSTSHTVPDAAPRGCNTLTIALSIENQVYITWTKSGQPSVAPLITTTDSCRWELKSTMNIRSSDGKYMSPSEFLEHSQRLGYKLFKVKPKVPSITGFSDPIVHRDKKEPDPEAWSSLEKFNKFFGTDLRNKKKPGSA